MSQIILTGFENGYLGGALEGHIFSRERGKSIYHYGNILKAHENSEYFNDIDTVYHFAGPSDTFDFLDQKRTASTIIEGTTRLLKLAMRNNARFIFTSTMGVYNAEMNDIYCTCKLAMENYIRSVYNNYIILRVPRVYSKCRQKGLMRKIRDNLIPEKDMKNQVEFITLEDFVDQTLSVLDDVYYHRQVELVHEYTITQKKTIQEIKDII